jgi:hypothetical protein
VGRIVENVMIDRLCNVSHGGNHCLLYDPYQKILFCPTGHDISICCFPVLFVASDLS